MAQSNKVKTISSQIMELKDLISNPLTSTIDADYTSTQRYLDYLYELAFDSCDRTTGVAGNIRMLTFTYQEQDRSGTSTKKINIPLLSLVPLPLLQIKEATFDFEVQIIDVVTQETDATFSFSDSEEGKASVSKSAQTKLRVSLAPNSGSSTASTRSQHSPNMKVKVMMQHADMPAGLSNFLHLASHGVLIDDEDKKNE